MAEKNVIFNLICYDSLINYYDLTKEERAQLMIQDYETYKELVPDEVWLQILEPIAKMKPPDLRNTKDDARLK